MHAGSLDSRVPQPYAEITMRSRNQLMFGVILFLLCGGAVLFVLFPGARWSYPPLHVFVESLGAFTALLTAALIMLLKVYERLPARYIWIGAALAGMGVLDGFHALSDELQRFVWLHTLAMLFGGVMATLIWLPESVARRGVEYRVPLIVVAVALLTGGATLIHEPVLPMLNAAGGFTRQAGLMNAAAGVLFLFAAAAFMFGKPPGTGRDNGIFIGHYLLLGVAGLLFPFSILWDLLWWYWHLLRFVAYAAVLYYLFLLSRSEERQLLALNSELEERVQRRTNQLHNELKARKRIEKELKHQATHDPLTGLYNRNALERRIADDLARAKRYRHSLSLFMVDIDHFKEINDRYGHASGDRVLRSIAIELERSLRKTDYVARFGGEEFLVVLPETPLVMAVELGERLLRLVSSHQVGLESDSVSLTISIGVASYPEIAKDWHELLDAADMAMYQAKHDGRNCLRTARSEVN
jgi:diguanylate cyclase (GGDEF)-like protein